MASYSGMTLKGEIRESISLDDDDLSDVEDEVFIRDGKNGYKLAEELTVKRPLMPPRKRAPKSEIRTVLKRRSNCKAFCKPCCYLYIALSIFIGLISLVVVIVSIYPLPLNTLKQWTWMKSEKEDLRLNVLPCNNLRIQEVWSVKFPKLTTESSMRVLDINDDGVEDILFGFGTGNNYNILPSDVFCPIFMGMSPPCEGGVIALNGTDGEILWTRWMSGNVFRLQCTVDIDGDQLNDCLAVGTEGTIMTINSKTGAPIWQLNADEKSLYVASFIADQNNDTIPDVLASHSLLGGDQDGHIVLLSGKNGEVIQKLSTPNGTNAYYMPQVLTNTKGSFVLFGTGTPNSPGNLSIIPLAHLTSGKMLDQSHVLYEDKTGILNPSVCVDITGDNVTDIITTMVNTGLVAINGETFEQIWNFSIPGNNSETEITATPGYFNSDNYTDFLVIYQASSNNTNRTLNTQVFIIDGKTGKLIDNPSNDSIRTQISGLTLSMEPLGYDMFLFWTKDCDDQCRNQSNLINNVKLNALSQFHQPPGFTIFSTADMIQDDNKILSAMKQLREYFNHSSKSVDHIGQSEINEKYAADQRPIVVRKYGSSHSKARQRNNDEEANERLPFPSNDYKWSQDQNVDFNEYMGELEGSYPGDDSEILNKGIRHSSNRDPRNKDEDHDNKSKSNSTKTKKKNLSDGMKGIYDLKNIRLAKNRLLHDLDHVPTDILKDTFVKNEEKRLKKSKFEQRDVGTHYDKVKEKQEIQKTIQEELITATNRYNLWDIESEREARDKDDSKLRIKRRGDYFTSNHDVTSVGAIVESLNRTYGTNAIDIVFVTQWKPPAFEEQHLLKQDIEDCVMGKLSTATKGASESEEMKTKFKRECVEEQQKLRIKFNYFDKISQFNFGQITVHRLRIECECVALKKDEVCSKFLPEKQQSWPSYLGLMGNGIFLSRP